MAIELVTGHAGTDHVSSADMGRYHAGVCGPGKYVLATGQQFTATIASANLIRVASGDAVNQGRHITIPQNTYEEAAITNGTQGKARIDVIALRYTKTTQEVEGVVASTETVALAVIKGTEVSNGITPEAPSINDGDIFDGAVIDDMPLYHVLITDTSITSVTPVFEVMKGINQLSNSITDVANAAAALGGRLTTAENDIDDIEGDVAGLAALLTNFVKIISVNMAYTEASARVVSIRNYNVAAYIPAGYVLKGVYCSGCGSDEFYCVECDIEDGETSKIKARFYRATGSSAGLAPWVRLICVKELTT